MRLEKASTKAIKYAIMNFHYSKKVPMVQSAFSVFNEKKEWCGVICYSLGATNKIASPFKMKQGQVIELVRVALNGKQESTTKALSLSLRLIRKLNPLVKLIVSYADMTQGHRGIIYQASNWSFIGSTKPKKIYKKDGKQIHDRWISSKGWKYNTNGTIKKCIKPEECEISMSKQKYKYIYPLDKSTKLLCKSLAKPYPKSDAKEV